MGLVTNYYEYYYYLFIIFPQLIQLEVWGADPMSISRNDVFKNRRKRDYTINEGNYYIIQIN